MPAGAKRSNGRDVAEMDEIAMRLGHDQLTHADSGAA